MIRIGFIAILALLVLYIFRFFFLPSVNVVIEALDVDQQKGKSAVSNIELESELEKRKIVEQKQTQHFTDQIEKLLFETSKLKEQLIDANASVKDLKEKNTQLIQGQTASTGDGTKSAIGVPEASGDAASNADYIVNLKQKVDQLESRLVEYEIIAEDISEIGQLRKENSDLKKRLSSNAISSPEATAVAPSEELLVVDEAAPEAEAPEVAAASSSVLENVSESLIEELTEIINEPEVEAVAGVKLVSEKEVSVSEQDLIDHFEETTNRKGS